MMFRLPLATRIEMIHPDDAGLAVAAAIDCEAVWGRILNIGGGARCQLIYREYLGAFLDAMGIGRLPDEAFSTEPYCTDWLDTEESQRLLQYQRQSFGDVVRQTAALLGWRGARSPGCFAPWCARPSTARMSPHWRGRSGTIGVCAYWAFCSFSARCSAPSLPTRPPVANTASTSSTSRRLLRGVSATWSLGTVALTMLGVVLVRKKKS